MGKFACMTQKHVKSPCCRGKIYRYGQRRRQCSICKQTWRIRQKKQGRKSKRANVDIVKRYLSHSFNLHEPASRIGITVPALRKRVRQNLNLLLETEQWMEPPENKNLIVIIDALLQKIFFGKSKRYYTVYLVLLRALDSEKAVILKPLVFPRYENKADWEQALNNIPKSARSRILALVGDGKPCFLSIAKDNNWLLQRCHFHLLAELNRYASYKRKSKNRELISRIYKEVRIIITTGDRSELQGSLEKISQFTSNPDVPQRIKTRFLKGLLRNHEYYRTYLNYSELNLPTTSNSCEALNSIIGNFFIRTRGINSPEAFRKLVQALMLIRKMVNCKGANFPPN